MGASISTRRRLRRRFSPPESFEIGLYCCSPGKRNNSSIADAENIEASDEELEKEFNDMAAMYGMTTEDLKKQLAGQEKYVKQDIRNRKAIDFIYENAVLTDVEDVPAEAPAEEASEEKNAEETSEN